jgi:thiamine-monophosphate kinase
MTQVPLGPGGEFDRIRAIAAALGDAMGPIGDDTAAIPAGEGTLVVSVDASVEDVHFRRGWLSHEEIGWRATAGALSDLAAAAATPVGVVAAVVVPRKSDEKSLVDVMRGVGAAAASVGARLLGGDLTSGAQWAVVVTVFGRAVRPMSRAGARSGDGVWVTGVLGGARSALQAWTTSIEPDADARRIFAHPVPRIDAAQWLAAHGASALMDLSDGLGGDAEHLAMASGVQLEIELERLPLHRSVAAAARHIGDAPEMFAVTAGEDYELLVTLPNEFTGAEEFTRVHGIDLTRIGSVTAGAGVRATLGGKVRSVHGFRHAV